MQDYVLHQFNLRKIHLHHLCALRSVPIGEALEQLRCNEPSEHLKQAICAELGFQSWEQLTKAALADNNELLEV